MFLESCIYIGYYKINMYVKIVVEIIIDKRVRFGNLINYMQKFGFKK